MIDQGAASLAFPACQAFANRVAAYQGAAPVAAPVAVPEVAPEAVPEAVLVADPVSAHPSGREAT